MRDTETRIEMLQIRSRDPRTKSKAFRLFFSGKDYGKIGEQNVGGFPDLILLNCIHGKDYGKLIMYNSYGKLI